jgi:ribonuclease-3
VGEVGPDHDKTFEVRLTVGNAVVTHGRGKSKKNAEQAAASVALLQLGREDDNQERVE